MVLDNDDFEILIGTYEEFVLGYRLKKGEDNVYSLTQTFVTHSHQASVRSVAATDTIAASCGSDETIVLYDLINRKQSGALMQHEGTVTCVRFTPDGSHLISCSDDGSIAIFRVGSWQLEKLFKKAHKGTAVNHIAIHQSGKLALSVGKDNTIRTWNLMTGRLAFVTNLASLQLTPGHDSVDSAVWSLDGVYCALPVQTKVVIFSIAKGALVNTVSSTSKVHTVCFLEGGTNFCIGNEESVLAAYNFLTGSVLWTLTVGTTRIKSIATSGHALIAITSGGDLNVWDCSEKSGEPRKVADTKDACRFTCLYVVPRPIPRELKKAKKKKKTGLKNKSLIAKDSGSSLSVAETSTKSRKEMKSWKVESNKNNNNEVDEDNDDDDDTVIVNKTNVNEQSKDTDEEEEVIISIDGKKKKEKKNIKKTNRTKNNQQDEDDESKCNGMKKLKKNRNEMKRNSFESKQSVKRKNGEDGGDEVCDEYVDMSLKTGKRKRTDKRSVVKKRFKN